MKRNLIRALAQVIGVVCGVIGVVWIVVAQPSCRRNLVSEADADPARLRGHVETLSQRYYPRNWQSRTNLDGCAEYIAQHFRKAGAAVELQTFFIGNKEYRNVIGKFNPARGTRVVVGAHYDSCDLTPGADDNASGVAALIELAYLVGRTAPSIPLDLVAYTLEEPPFFKTQYMGSAIHAKSVVVAKTNIQGVIVLEMVGYFNDEWGSQSYPVPILRLIYPRRADFIAVVGLWKQGDWISRVKGGMQGATDLPVYSIRAPAILPGIDFSDHMNYWPYGIPAIMVTDTAFYRNAQYHLAGDTSDRLDYVRLAKVVIAVFETIKVMCSG